MLGSIREMFQDLSVSSAVSTFPVWQRHKSPALKKKKKSLEKKQDQVVFLRWFMVFFGVQFVPFTLWTCPRPALFLLFPPSFFLSFQLLFFLERWFQGYTSTTFWHLAQRGQITSVHKEEIKQGAGRTRWPEVQNCEPFKHLKEKDTSCTSHLVLCRRFANAKLSGCYL